MGIKKSVSVLGLGRMGTALASALVDEGYELVVDRVRGLQDIERDARLIDQTQPLLLGFQCGKALPMTGVLDDATLEALGA